MPVLVTDVVVLRLCVAEGVLLGEGVYVDVRDGDTVKVGDDENVLLGEGVNVGEALGDTVMVVDVVLEGVGVTVGEPEGVPVGVLLWVEVTLDVTVTAAVLVIEGVMVTVFDMVAEPVGVEVIEAPADGVAEQEACDDRPEAKQHPLVQEIGACEASGQ